MMITRPEYNNFIYVVIVSAELIEAIGIVTN
jgi:hypothetical protein